jgi:hypothetical protein
VRLSTETRDFLDAVAADHESAGASALAREILEAWVAAQRAELARAGVQRAISYLHANPNGWNDDPDDFFPPARKLK